MPSRLNPYFNFDGKTKEAMEFYKSVFGGSLSMSTFQEGGMPVDPGEENKIMHAVLIADNGMALMSSDVPNKMKAMSVYGNTVSISLSGDDEAELRGYWDKLSERAQVDMPLTSASWGDTFGMLTDEFGIRWMVNIAGKK